jgi:hypothetical protein
LLGLLGVPDGIVIMAFLESMSLIEFTLILFIIAGVRGVVTRARRRSTGHGCHADPTSLGGPGHILSLLGLLLLASIHPEGRDREEINHKVWTIDNRK